MAAKKQKRQNGAGPQKPARRVDPRSVRAALQSQVTTALDHLQRTEPSDQDVHAARKCIKKSRASLRLLRDVIPVETYRRENETLRDAARPLSATRDAKILIDALDSLVEKEAVDARAAQTLREVLSNERKRLQRKTTSKTGLTSSRRVLKGVQGRAQRWPLSRDDGALILHALKRVYKRSRRGLADARSARNSENLHDWRKQVKYLWHQLQMLETVAPNEINELADKLHKLSDYLGDDHDLAVLREKVVSHPKTLSRNASRALLTCIDERRTTLQEKAFTLGSRMFSRGASTFVERFGKLRSP